MNAGWNSDFVRFTNEVAHALADLGVPVSLNAFAVKPINLPSRNVDLDNDD